ncbi:MAG TPA: Gfo/Idh/MocA family oxidoreductase [Chthoniobacter sp.]|jgi:predicted dehydrogenase
MNPSDFGFGIVGPGMIAVVVADALAQAKNTRLRAVSSRTLANAQKFTANRPGVDAVEGYEALLHRDDVQAVYIATPTVAKEAIALAAVAAGKHILVDKPFVDRASVARMSEAAAGRGLVFMDATHFVHHPRTAAIQAATAELIGAPQSLHTAFYFPFSDQDNIRFNPRQEPMTVLGDMAWYSMRAVVEYLRPAGPVRAAFATGERSPLTNAFVRVEGLIAFESGEASTFDVGYTADTILMDLQLLGTKGVIGMDDFVLDWTNSFAFKNPEIAPGYTYRTGMASRQEIRLVPAPPATPQEVAMVEDFATLATSGNTAERARYAAATWKTQEYLDALWQALNR